MTVQPRFVGRSLLRREDERFLVGSAQYVDDLELPGLVHVVVVRSPFARALVRGVSADGGGALLVVTGADLAGRVAALPVQPVEGVELCGDPHPVLAVGEVRYVGQPVAAVVADTRAAALDAAELVEVDYEPLDPVVDPGSSCDVSLRWSRTAGDVDGAFAGAAHVVARRFVIPRLVAAPIEPRGAVASYDLDEDRLTVWVSAQDPHRQRSGLAHVLGRAEATVRVIVPDVGGAFGSKGSVSPETCVAAYCALALGRPVKWVEDRRENFLAAVQGRGLDADVELALDGDGRFVALRARLQADLGGYLLPTTAIPPHTAAMLMTGCYEIPAVEVDLVGVRTNKVPTGPYRGAGRPEAALLLERTIDEAARELNLDRIELRRRNLIRRDAFPYRTPLGWTYDSGDYARCLELALELARDESPERDDDHAVGFGVGLYVERAGGAWEGAQARIEPDGRVSIACGVSPHGQGHDTTLGQIAADALDLELADIELRFGDSDAVTGVGTFASRSVAVGGPAVIDACQKLRQEAEAATGQDWLSIDRCRLAGLTTAGRFESPLVFSSGCAAATVAIERATGTLRVLGLVAVDDAGRIVNPLLAEGQVVGGAAQALGECLFEEATYDEDGNPQATSFLDYGIPTASDIPPIETAFVETPSPYNPLGAKGIGEGGAIGTLAAIANAVTDALGRHVDPPYTHEKLWRELS